MDQIEDNLLARLAVDVDHSFEMLMVHYWQQLCVFVVRRRVSPQDAEDIVAEAFVRAYLALKSYPVERIRTLKLRAWLYKITYNEYYRHVGRAAHPAMPFSPLEEGLPLEKEQDQSGQPELLFESAERRQELECLVATLPERYREAINLYYFEEFSYQEIADFLEQPIGTVKSNVHRGIRLLRKALSMHSNEVC